MSLDHHEKCRNRFLAILWKEVMTYIAVDADPKLSPKWSETTTDKTAHTQLSVLCSSVGQGGAHHLNNISSIVF